VWRAAPARRRREGGTPLLGFAAVAGCANQQGGHAAGRPPPRGVPAVGRTVAESADARIGPQHTGVLRRRRGAHGLRPLTAVTRGRAHEPRMLALGVPGGVVVARPELPGCRVDRRRRPELVRLLLDGTDRPAPQR